MTIFRLKMTLTFDLDLQIIILIDFGLMEIDSKIIKFEQLCAEIYHFYI